ncbi:MAG: dihydrofolate reductase family protein [Chloroflexia bacterium]|nr:dihydrofolate reductase family protein [Chloroflexia bacterium]
MSNVVYSMMVSLDGFVARPDGSLDWVKVDEELHTFVNDQQAEVGAYLYGRRLFELMNDFWPTADEDPSAPDYIAEFSRIWKEMPKVVFSRTLSHVDGNARLVSDDAAADVRRMKAQSGKNLDLGGPTLAASLIPLGLIDEYRLFLHPVALGNGLSFLPPDTKIDLMLVETRTFASGVVYLRYQRADMSSQDQ